jgi:hypothetical protein
MHVESVSCLTIEDFSAKMSELENQKSFPDKHESITDFSIYSKVEEDGARIFWSESKMKESFLLAWFMPLKRTVFKTRRIILRLENDKKEIKISLHELLRLSGEEAESKKRKFRFYIKQESLSEKFLVQCRSYLLNRISNNDLIKSIPHVKLNGQELL